MGWIEIFVLLFVTIGPVRASLVYLGLTKTADAALKRAIAIRSVTVSAVITVIFALLGAGILGGLKVSVQALLMAGGVILFVFAIQLVLGEDKEEKSDGPPPAPSMDIATYPLSVPLMGTRSVRNISFLTFTLLAVVIITPAVFAADKTAGAAFAFREDPLSGPDSVQALEKDFQESKSDLLDKNLLEKWELWKSGITEETGFSFGGDYTAVGFAATSSPGEDKSASGIARFYGSWELLNRGAENTGRLVYKIEHRHKYTDVPPQTFGFEIGYAGLPNPVFNNDGFRVTELNWGQHFQEGRVVTRLGFVDVKAYYDVFALASPWAGFGNLAFVTASATQAVLPDGAFGAMVGGYLTDEIYAIAGIADASADPTDVFGGFDTFFNDFDTFKTFEIGITGGGNRLFADNLHLALWQRDDSEETGTQGGWGFNVSASNVINDQWLPFLRGGWTHKGNSIYEASVSAGFGYMNQPGGNLLGVGLNWGRPNSNTFPIDLNDQWTGEIFYRVQLAENIQITPSVQLLLNPALYETINAPDGGADKDFIALFGVRARAQF